MCLWQICSNATKCLPNMSPLELPVRKLPQLCPWSPRVPRDQHTSSNNHSTKEIQPEKHHTLFLFLLYCPVQNELIGNITSKAHSQLSYTTHIHTKLKN